MTTKPPLVPEAWVRRWCPACKQEWLVRAQDRELTRFCGVCGGPLSRSRKRAAA